MESWCPTLGKQNRFLLSIIRNWPWEIKWDKVLNKKSQVINDFMNPKPQAQVGLDASLQSNIPPLPPCPPLLFPIWTDFFSK